MQPRYFAHYLLRAALSGGFALYIIHLVKSGKLMYYIAPRMETIVKLSAVALALIAIYLVFAALWALQGTAPSCGCHHMPGKSPVKNTVAYSLLAAPLILGWFVPDAVMGSKVVDMKGIVLSKAPTSPAVSAPPGETVKPPSTAGDPQPVFISDDPFAAQYSKFAERLFAQDPIVIKEDTYLEAISAIDLFMEQFQGKAIEISGFVYRQEDMSDTQFVVARLAMECCSADATPYGFLVEWPEAKTLPEDTWVKVYAAISSSMFGGMEIVTLRASRVESIEAPETPYVYPNYDVLDNLQP